MKHVFDRRLLAAALLAVALVASGCGKSTSPTSPGGGLSQDSADDIALQTAATLDLVGLDMEAAFAGGMGPAPMVQPGPTPTAALWDTTFTHDGLTISASRNFYDVQGNVLPGFGPTAVKLVWTSRIYGTLEMERDTATVGHSASLEFRGIQPADAAITVNGASLDTLLNRFRSYDGTRTRYFYWNSALTAANVVQPKATEWPLSGTLTFVVQADRLRSNNRGDVEAHLNATVVVTFNGTSQPDIVVNGTWHYKWNLMNGTVTRV